MDIKGDKREHKNNDNLKGHQWRILETFYERNMGNFLVNTSLES